MDGRIARLTLEWIFWCALVLVLWSQTDAFSESIAEYAFGAAGWPRAILIGLLLGATGQWALGILGHRLGRGGAASQSTQGEGGLGGKAERSVGRLQQIAIFAFPMLYLWLMHRIGFFVATPLFILGYLMVLEVRNWRHLAGVTVAVYGTVLLVFVRFFYVALPVGAWQAFYDINNWIITMVRLGV